MTQVTTGSFTNVASTPYFLPLSQQVSEFELVNQTKLASYTSARVTNAYWNNYMAADTAIVDAPTTVTGPLNTSAVIRTLLAQNGITIFNAATQLVGAPVAIASFVPGQPTVFTCGGAHGLKVGDNVRIYGMTTAPQLGGLLMTVTAVAGGGTTFTTLLDSTNALTSVGFVRKVGNAYLPTSSLYYPGIRAIATITQANPMVVTTLVPQNYQIGDVVRFAIPTAYGMPQLNSTTSGLPLQFTVTAVNSAVGTQTVTFGNVNSSAFTALKSVLAINFPVSYPQMIPQGEGNLNNLTGVVPSPFPYGNQDILSFATQNLVQNGILIGAGDGTATASTGSIIGATADVWTWKCTTALQQFPQI